MAVQGAVLAVTLRDVCLRFNAFRERGDKGRYGMAYGAVSWYCCAEHYPSDATDADEWKDAKNLAAWLGQTSCEVTITEDQAHRLRAWKDRKGGIAISLPIYRYPLYFDAHGLTCGGPHEQ